MRVPRADQMYLSDALNDRLVPSNDVDGVVLAPYAIVLPRAGKIASICALLTESESWNDIQKMRPVKNQKVATSFNVIAFVILTVGFIAHHVKYIALKGDSVIMIFIGKDRA